MDKGIMVRWQNGAVLNPDITPLKHPMTDPQNQTETARIVIEYDAISHDKEAQFRRWQSEIRESVGQFKGYLHTDICPPIQGLQDKWYIVVHFDSPTSLGEWLDSDIRHQVISLGKRKFGPYRYNIQTGLEGWFRNRRQIESQTQSAPPAWKQNFAVLFGLYPTVMLETLLFQRFHVMESWPLALGMFVNNLVSCSLLTWVVMPLTTRLLNFWLNPQRTDRSSMLTTIMGMLIVVAAYAIMISVFHALS